MPLPLQSVLSQKDTMKEIKDGRLNETSIEVSSESTEYRVSAHVLQISAASRHSFHFRFISFHLHRQ